MFVGPPFQGKSVFWPSPADISNSGHEPPLTFPLVEGAVEKRGGGGIGPSQLKKSRRSTSSELGAARQSQLVMKKRGVFGDRWGLVLMRDVDEGKRSVCSTVGGGRVVGGGRDGEEGS